jgi:hypothetical protein
MIKCIDCDKPPHPRKQNEDGELLSDKDIAPIMEGIYKPDRYWGRKQIGEKIFQKCYYLCSKCSWTIHKQSNKPFEKRWNHETNDWGMYDPNLEENEEEEKKRHKQHYTWDKGLYGLQKGEEIRLTNRTVTYDDLEPKDGEEIKEGATVW